MASDGQDEISPEELEKLRLEMKRIENLEGLEKLITEALKTQDEEYKFGLPVGEELGRAAASLKFRRLTLGETWDPYWQHVAENLASFFEEVGDDWFCKEQWHGDGGMAVDLFRAMHSSKHLSEDIADAEPQSQAFWASLHLSDPPSRKQLRGLVHGMLLHWWRGQDLGRTKSASDLQTRKLPR